MKLSFEQEKCTFCCGFHEVGNMETYPDNSNYDDDDFYGNRDEVDLDKATPEFFRESKGRPVMFNFVRQRRRTARYDEWAMPDWWKDVPLKRRYEAAPLRQIVKRYPGVKHIGTWINPGTGNEIDSYVIVKEKK